MLSPITLEGDFVRLEPLDPSHSQALQEAIADGELWRLFVTLVPKPADVGGWIERALSEQQAGLSLPFVTYNRATHKIVGSSRYMKIDLPNKRLEIGSTFIAKSEQRSAINTEAKLLMLTHAFETLGLNRVEFLTDYLNTASRNAILRLGSKQEGILRSHMVMPDGRVRDSVLFSITANEWPGVRQNLRSKLI